MVFDNADDAQEIAEKFDKEVLKIKLPHSTFCFRYYAGDISLRMVYENLFNDTVYETNENRLSHFTSLQGLISILKGGFLRLSEMNHLNDNNELHYGAKVFKSEKLDKVKLDEIIKTHKENCFTLSTCISSTEINTNFFMWETYGNKGNGAIIEFEIVYNDVKSILLGKMQYGIDELEPLKDINDLADTFYKNNNFKPTNFPLDIIELLAFHKEKKYTDENEVRLFIKLDKPKDGEHIHFATYQDITNTNDVKWFFRLFLEGRKDVLEKEGIEKELIDDYFDFYPTIKIKRILLGSSISFEQKRLIFNLLNEIKKPNNFYDFEIVHLNNENEVLKFCQYFRQIKQLK